MAERAMLAHATSGEKLAWPTADGPISRAVMATWGPERTVRASVLRQLLAEGTWPVHSKGVRLHGVRVQGQLDLEHTELRCPLLLDCCLLEADSLDGPDEPIVLDYAMASRVELTSCHLPGLRANLAVITKELDLTGSVFRGPVTLLSARIA